MRTTLNLDEDVVEAAKALARVEGRSLGEAISELARRGLGADLGRLDADDGFPTFRVPPGTPPITEAAVRAGLDEP